MIKKDNDLAEKELFEALKEALKGIPNNNLPAMTGYYEFYERIL